MQQTTYIMAARINRYVIWRVITKAYYCVAIFTQKVTIQVSHVWKAAFKPFTVLKNVNQYHNRYSEFFCQKSQSVCIISIIGYI